MVFNAISIGYAIPHTDFDAVVHSVFRSAINLCSIRGGELLTLVAASESDLPQGIRVDVPDNFSFEILNVGEQVICRNETLRLDSLTVDLRGARRWKCDLPALQADAANPAMSAAWSFVWDALNKRQIQSKAEIIAGNIFHSEGIKQSRVAEKTGDAMRELFEATQRCDDLSVASPVRALIGLGAGLTPSGDDLLVGYLAGLWCAIRDGSERIQFVSDLGKTIIHFSHLTNDISRTYLYHAAQGQVSSSLVNLANVICMGEKPDRLLDIAETAMNIGHTSGMDTVTGLLLGLTAWSQGCLN